MTDQGQDPYVPQRFADAVRLHEEGRAGNKEAVRKARAELQSLYELHPEDANVKAYYGSALTLAARDFANSFERLRLAKQGLSLLDEAVAGDPNNRLFRMMRGKIAYRLPEAIFHRTETAIKDFAVLIDAEMQRPGTLDAATYATLVYELGDAYSRTKRSAEARVCWKHLKNISNDPALLSKANARLSAAKAASDSSSMKRKNKSLRPDDIVGMLIGLAGASLLRFAQRK